jgi:acyl-CoA dehydrogenase
MKVLDKGRLHIAAACVGLSDRIIDDMIAYAVGRRQFGRPLADFPVAPGLFADQGRGLCRALHGDRCGAQA